MRTRSRTYGPPVVISRRRNGAATQSQHSQYNTDRTLMLTELPKDCRIVLTKYLDSRTRATWRTVCKLTNEDVHAATHDLTWLGAEDEASDDEEDLSTEERISIYNPNESVGYYGSPQHPPPTTLPRKLIQNLPSLQNLTCTFMNKLRSIQGIPSTLRTLYLWGCTSLRTVAPLQHCTTLTELRLTVRRKDLAASLPPVMTAISGSLRQLELALYSKASSTACESAMLSLAPLTGLEQLRLSVQTKNMTHWQPLALAVGRMTRLQVLDTRLASIEHGAMTLLAHSIACLPPTLTTLDLRGKSSGISYAAAAAVGSALGSALQAHAATLRRVRLSDTHFGQDGMAALAAGMRCCKSLAKVNMSNCNIEASGSAALATALSGSAPSLTSLNLSENALENEGAAALAPVLGRMTSLTKLKYLFNHQSAAGAAALAPALLRIAPSLTFLDLNNGSWTMADADASAASLSSALRCMTALTQLDYTSSMLGPVGAAAVASAIPTMTRLKRLDLGDNPLGFGGLRALAQGLQALPGRQQWEVQFVESQVWDGMLRYQGDAQQLAYIVKGVASLQECKVKRHNFESDDMEDEEAVKVLGLEVKISA